MYFHSLSLSPLLLKNIEKLGYHTPTPIQEKSLPYTLQGNDLIGIAQTGTGKTAAFILPILEQLLHRKQHEPAALVLVPTRELAEQIDKEFKRFGQDSRLQGVLLYGGINIEAQIRKLRKGVDIIIACPGRLLDHMRRGTVRLNAVKIMVLDEADCMLDMGFIENVQDILNVLPQEKQTLLFSATMPSEIVDLAEKYLKEPKTVQIAPVSPAHTVKQQIYRISEKLKADFLFELLNDLSKQLTLQSVLIFTRTKQRAVQLAEQLTALEWVAEPFQSNMTQRKRQKTLQQFREGRFQILVATDIAARGIDITHVSHVINFDFPNTVESYTHRIGRTGRANQTGHALTLVTSFDLAGLRKIERQYHIRLQNASLEHFDYKNTIPKFVLKEPKFPTRNRIQDTSTPRNRFQSFRRKKG